MKSSGPPARPEVDIERVLHNLNRSLNPLHRECLLDYHVSGVRNGYVYLSIALPEGMTRVFVQLLESLHGFFRFVDRGSKTAAMEARFEDPEEKVRRENVQAKFRFEVCETFDGFRDQGMQVKEAVKATNSALKAKGNPWATHAVVTDVLRAAGRFRRKD